MDDSIAYLEKLRHDVQVIIESIAEKNKSDYSDEAINWADLICVETSKVMNNYGNVYYRVLIEEAAPACPNLQLAIQEELAELGYDNVCVDTAW